MTQEFRSAVESNNVAYVRMMLSNELILDPRGASFDEMLEFAKGRLRDLFEEEVQCDFEIPVDKEFWNDDVLSKMKRALNINFSTEKLSLYVTIAKHIGAEKAKEMNMEQSSLTRFNNDAPDYRNHKKKAQRLYDELIQSIALSEEVEKDIKCLVESVKQTRKNLNNIQRTYTKHLKKTCTFSAKQVAYLECLVKCTIEELQEVIDLKVQRIMKQLSNCKSQFETLDKTSILNSTDDSLSTPR